MVAVTYGSARVGNASVSKAQPKRKGFFARLGAAMMQARLQQAYREIELHQHLLHDNWQNDIKR